MFSGFKRAKRYKYFSFEIDAFRKLNEVVLRLKHWAVELCESASRKTQCKFDAQEKKFLYHYKQQ